MSISLNGTRRSLSSRLTRGRWATANRSAVTRGKFARMWEVAAAIDTQTGAQFLKNNAGVIAQTIAAQVRNGNSSPRMS